MKRKTKVISSLLIIGIIGIVAFVILSRGESSNFDAPWVADQAKMYVDSRNDLSEAIRDSILAGKVVVGMSPDEAVAAGGRFRYVIEDGERVMASVADIRHYFDYMKKKPEKPRMPPDILWMQRDDPTEMPIFLDFLNKTQFDTETPEGFRAYFASGRVLMVERFKTEKDD